MQALAHRSLGNTEQGRQLRRRHSFQVVEDNRLPGVRRQPLDGIQNDPAALGAPEIAVRGVVARQVGGGGIEDLPRRLALAPGYPGAAAVFHYRSQPARKQGGVPETVETEVGAQEHLLGDVAGGVEISCPRQGDREDCVLVVLDQAGEGGLVAVEGGGHQRRGLYGIVQWIGSVSICRERPAMDRDVTCSPRVVLPLRCTPPAVMALSCPDLSNNRTA